ncbi:MAG: SPFH domain-containing protein [Gemmatimonadota bacterium]|nr:SPFH domain-containing protein [Gemmatimonadota bacterium]MDH5757965.1 SPFH domain-containing protein [Gemmatimonadota bacterium]
MQGLPEYLVGPATLALVVIAVLIVLVMTVKALIVIVPPNRASVITGRTRTLSDGQRVGYRSVIGGRTLRIPVVESVQFMNLETFAIEISVHNAFSKGNIPLNVEAIANVKLASDPETVFNNAVERLLGKTEGEIQQLAKDTLMGNLRGVLATLTPEEVNEDRLGFAKALAEDAGEDLAALGFHLDVLKIQNVSDERGYLEAIGRKKAAEAVREAEIAEANAEADTREAQADARQRAEIREAGANIKIAEANNQLRVRQAELDQEAEIAEKTAKVRAEEAKVEAERALEAKRVQRETERLRADVIEPANADRDAALARAEGDAAPILERGKAQVEVLRRLYEQVQTGGDQAFAVFLAEKLPDLLEIAVGAIEGVDIDRVVVMDGGDGNGVSNAVNQKVKGAFGTMEGLASALGLDIQEVLANAVARIPAKATTE